MTTPLLPASEYYPGKQAFIDPSGLSAYMGRMLQLRNRVIAAGLDVCARCDGLGVTQIDGGPCQLCRGTGNAAGRVT